MLSDPMTLYKLMNLYMLKQVNFPLTNAQLTEFFLQHEYASYFSLQQALNELQESGLIRTEEVGNTASTVSAYPAVRAHLLGLQRNLAAGASVIMDGRDIGTCVLPDAETKIFLTASPSVRAMRRFKELKEKGIMCNLQEIEQDIIERDQRDTSRAAAPLKQAEDAVLVDGSDMTIEQVVSIIMDTAISHGLKVKQSV